ncbi:PaaI family thioesterase [Sedimentitalea sp. JM2-8]|uniref:PaaI family thioesterase n=1 Tax=Sedimentitalea xiamensis TaxID=3050037 RepID=A0ABT7FHQ3_9RHOB|nr:PaaI family thioesterase [Sedimentitalea xiamensis]MDK3074608.1 PaaI family thioesterase [Sedimentitalea xiamensis]
MTKHTRSYDYITATFDPAAAMRLSGLDYMQALVAGQIGAPPSILATMGMSPPCELAVGEVAFDCEPGDFLLNPMGFVHGGFAATALDSSMGMAVHTTLDAGWGFTTAELKINYTRAILPDGGPLRAEGSVIHRGQRMATAEGRLVGLRDGKLYAHGSTTCFLFALADAKA